MLSLKVGFWFVSVLLLWVPILARGHKKMHDGFARLSAAAPPMACLAHTPLARQVLEMAEEPNLELSLWYPAEAGADEAKAYAYQVKLPVLGAVTIATDASYAVPGAAYDLARGPYPLVVLSPGFAMSASSYGWLAQHLASHGFVVLAVEHDERMNPGTGLWQGAVKTAV
ncbi:MAG: hypothetical protein R3D55_24910 [Chloroflexota bacterium]